MKLRRIAAWLCFVLAALIAAPFAVGFRSEGALAAIMFSVIGVLLFSPKWLNELTKKCRWVKTLLAVCCIFAVTVCLVVSAVMATAVVRGTSEEAKTLVVLGCQVKEGKPSEMLKRRLDAAVEYLGTHPECVVIVTGAQGSGEDMPEADVMYSYLIENGIAKERIFKESNAIRTSENIRFSAEIIKREELGNDVIIVTDAFHQYRAACFAKENGLFATPLSSGTPLFVFLIYWFREILAVLRMYILGY